MSLRTLSEDDSTVTLGDGGPLLEGATVAVSTLGESPVSLGRGISDASGRVDISWDSDALGIDPGADVLVQAYYGAPGQKHPPIIKTCTPVEGFDRRNYAYFYNKNVRLNGLGVNDNELLNDGWVDPSASDLSAAHDAYISNAGIIYNNDVTGKQNKVYMQGPAHSPWDTLGAMTALVRFKLRDNSGRQYLAANSYVGEEGGHNYTFGLSITRDELRAFSESGEGVNNIVSFPFEFEVGVEYDVAMVRHDTGAVSLYAGGVLLGTKDGPLPTGGSESQARIASMYQFSNGFADTQYLRGEVYALVMDDNPLPAGEIAEIFRRLV